ncbi:MAG: helix-turn-helix domain-containing protein, partial [Candidatus Paceibacterota bacterium]|jgi:hypothetical protein
MEKQICTEYSNPLTVKELMKKYRCRRDRLKEILHKHGVLVKNVGGAKKLITKEEEQAIIALYNQGLGTPAISKRIGYSPRTIWTILKDNDIVIKRKIMPNMSGLKNQRVASIKHNCAAKRGLSWELSNAEAINIMEQPCHYCGNPASNTVKRVNLDQIWKCNGIDRKDNTLGYTKDNSLPCCKFCNAAKSDMTYTEFLKLIETIYQYRIVNNTIAAVGHQSQKIYTRNKDDW